MADYLIVDSERLAAVVTDVKSVSAALEEYTAGMRASADGTPAGDGSYRVYRVAGQPVDVTVQTEIVQKVTVA